MKQCLAAFPELKLYYSGRQAARVKFSVAFANSSLLLFFLCVAIGQEITHKTSYMTK